MTTARNPQESAQFQRTITHILQSLTIAAIIGLGKLLYNLYDEVQEMNTQVAVLNANVSNMQDTIKEANLPVLRDQLTAVKANERYLQREVEERGGKGLRSTLDGVD